MAGKKPLKSAYELAMDRLRARDRDAGVADRKPLTKDQKDRIAEARRTAQAKVAEIEILYRDRRSEVAADAEKLREVEAHFDTDRRRIESALEAELARIRGE